MTDADVLARIARLPHGRATFKHLVREMGSRGEARAGLEDALKRLAARGDVIETRAGQFQVARMSREFAVGRLNVHRDGYGFVIPDAPPEWLAGDVFLPPQQAERAMHGDRVIARLVRVGADGRAEGEIVRVLKRAHPTVVGEFRARADANFVVPHDERIRHWILIPEGFERPPQGAAKDRIGAPPVETGDLDGMIVNAEILEYPERGDRAIGRVVEILGRPGDFGLDVEIVIRKHHIPHQFPLEVVDQARAIPAAIPADECLGRRDFRALDIVTIDGETARDFDDAVWVERLANGNFALQVHIADVSHYVRPGTPIDEEARLRGTSVYFPDRAVPMLPLELSTEICSLKPGVDRLVLSALLEIDHRGEVAGQEFTRGVIRSAARMTYTGVHAMLEGDPALRGRFETMRELALILNRKRVRRGSLDFDLPEPLIEFDEWGEMTGIARSPRNIAHRIIEEFMLAANEAVAAHLEEAGYESLFRIHEPPDPLRVMEFEELAARFGYSLGLRAAPEISSRLYQKLVAKIEGKPEERILSYLMLRSLRQARYSAENRGHFALAAARYTHFTSPIRRYPDLVVHRVLGAWLDSRPGGYTTPELRAIAIDSSDTERRAAEAERELVEWKKAKFMASRLGDEFDALVISTGRWGFFVELEELFVEGLVPIETLPGDRYGYQENTRRIVGERSRREFKIGDRVRVQLARVDALERKLQFALVGRPPARAPGP
ncbi:MAG: ribonuclease R [Bryobacterales bacterium]|nr:ribonuclease R [Bryobacterales bacterium]